jgi:hypothetical protein
MLATTEAANATEATKKLPFDVSAWTVSCRLKEAGLICRVQRSKPYLSLTNIGKCRAWALAHKSWTVKDWSHVIFSDESKFMLFKSDGHQYAWFKPGQALDTRFTKKTVKHCYGSTWAEF